MARDLILKIKLENPDFDYLDLKLPGIDSYKAEDNKIIVCFHSSESGKTSRSIGLIQAILFYALHLNGTNEVIVITCYSKNGKFTEWIKKHPQIKIIKNGGVLWHRVENNYFIVFGKDDSEFNFDLEN